MKRVLLASGFVVALGAAGTAQAADGYDWTGFYIGANAGYSWSKIDNTLSIENDSPNNFFNPPAIAGVEASGTTDLDSNSFTGGVQLGFNQELGGVANSGSNMVWGIEGDFNSLNLDETAGGRFLYTTNGQPYDLNEKMSTTWIATLRPRLGWSMNHTLLYATGGAAMTRLRFNQTFQEQPFTPTPEAAVLAKTKIGWTVGGGLEFALAEHWSLKTEYLYTRFSDADAVGSLSGANGSSAAPGFVDGATFTNALSDLTLHTVRGGINFQF